MGLIEPAMIWIEIFTVPSACTDLISNQVELAWLTCYPLHSKIIISKVIVDRGNKYLAKSREMITNDYSIKKRLITSRNPQEHAILERVHQTIGNILCAFKVQDMVLDDKILEMELLHHVCLKGYSIHYHPIHSCPISLWMRFNFKSTF